MSFINRDYQLAAFNAVNEDLKTHSSVLILMPTGTGKTHVMLALAQNWQGKCGVLVLCDRTELLDQAADKFERDLGYRPQVLQADREVNWHAIQEGQRVVVASVQTIDSSLRRLKKKKQDGHDEEKSMDKRLKMLMKIGVGLCMRDECHHATSPRDRRIMKFLIEGNINCKHVGVTATKRSDKKALGIVYEKTSFQMDSCEAIELGWLVEPIENRIVIDGVDFSKIEMAINEEGEVDFDRSQLESLMTEEGPIWAVAKPLIENIENRKCLVFTAGVNHAHLLAEVLNRNKPGSAAAIDGESTPPGHPRRTQTILDFNHGNLQYLVNYGICIEGFDSPSCSVVAIARPTKSLTLLIQMLGRALRPLPGVVDGHTSSEVRRAAIAESPKPTASIFYYIPKAANIKTVSVHDALGGNYADEVKELAKKLAEQQPGGKALDELKDAQALQVLISSQKARAKIEAEKVEVQYRVVTVGSGDGVSSDVKNIERGGCTDKQIEMLLALGVSYQKAASYGGRQAHMVIDKLRADRCTIKQRKTLLKFGEDPTVNYARAREIIDEIAARGWKRRQT